MIVIIDKNDNLVKFSRPKYPMRINLAIFLKLCYEHGGGGYTIERESNKPRKNDIKTRKNISKVSLRQK